MRFLGLDVAYVKDLGDDGILAASRAERRFLLTRDVDLAERAGRDPGSYLVRSLDPRTQLQEVVDALDVPLGREDYLTRCGACNAVLAPASVDEVRARVPPKVAELHDVFWECPTCRKVYWQGSHVGRIHDALDALRDERAPDAPGHPRHHESGRHERRRS